MRATPESRAIHELAELDATETLAVSFAEASTAGLLQATDVFGLPVSRMGDREHSSAIALERVGAEDGDTLFSLLHRLMSRQQAYGAATALMARYGTMTEALAAPAEELAGIEGVGIAPATALKTIHAVALRTVAAPLRNGRILNCRKMLNAYLVAVMAREYLEQARALFLDAKGRLLANEVLAVGGPRGVNPDKAALVRRAVQLAAAGIVLAHNHPSGDPTPSLEDVEATRAIQRALSAVSIEVYDHIVVARGGTVSLRHLRLLESGTPARALTRRLGHDQARPMAGFD